MTISGKSNTRKPAAKDRTVDMFTGKAKVDEIAAAIEDIEDEKREPAKPIEDEVDRYRNQSFLVQEWTSKHFPSPSRTGGVCVEYPTNFRWSFKGDFVYLEQVRSGKDGVAFHYAGVMFPISDWPQFIEATSACHKSIGSHKGKTNE